MLWRNNDVFSSMTLYDQEGLGLNLSSGDHPQRIISARFSASPEAEIWISLQADPNSANQAHYLSVAARLKPGVTLSQAQSEMRAVGERFRRLHPKMMDKNERVALTPMREAQVRDMKSALYMLLAAVAFVLLIACANVANLLLARSAARRRESAIRAAWSQPVAGCASFAGSALLLAAIGIYGLMSYAVEQQTQELGVRMALGPDKPAMVRLVMRQRTKPALIRVAAGLAVAFGVTRLLESLLYGVKPTDPLSFGVAGILILVAILAILIPARRAMSVDPVVALRTEYVN